jgi:uncharacterized protein YndB with AHSA1/START domain
MSGEFEVRREVVLPATPEQVWAAVATGPGLTAWFMPMALDPASDTVTAWEPGSRLAVRTPAAEGGAAQTFEYRIEPGTDGTVLRFVHGGLATDELAGITGRGWDMYLHTLAQYLRHFPGRAATYIEAEAPQSSADASAWPVLLRALGLPEAVGPGDAVRVTPDGLEPLAGTVDYLAADFLGIRTSDALYRFHGRAALGMTIAVGHHLYRDGVDPERTTRAWRTWLDGVFA